MPPAAPRTACVPDEACEFGFEIDPLSFLFNLKPDPRAPKPSTNMWCCWRCVAVVAAAVATLVMSVAG